MKLPGQLRSLAGRQHGLITRGQAEQHGISTKAWYRGFEAGTLVPVATRVAALPGAPATPERRILAAVLAAGPDAVASHRSAAHLWGVAGLADARVDVTFTNRNRSVSIPWVCTHTPTDLGDLRAVRRAGIPTTNPLRVLVDLGQVAPEAVVRALQQFLFDGLVSRHAVAGVLQRHARRGRHGIGALRDAMDAWAIDDRPPDSVLELRMARLLRDHGLPPAEFHRRVAGYEVDFAIDVHRIVLECDGWDAHGRNRRQFERDRERDPTLIATGWLILRFTWVQITRRPAWVATMIRQAIATRQAA
ncbi:MAG TPA: type IV toxin-antitoxin system AbiEi family antitoxin domain-containing protein [Acidimicrobiales bacterium]|nr:type IV toxin-antitoxin system AbiEi family antitoxin domain-containing protein [Acidimicrobiales bacterium]